MLMKIPYINKKKPVKQHSERVFPMRTILLIKNYVETQMFFFVLFKTSFQFNYVNPKTGKIPKTINTYVIFFSFARIRPKYLI